MVPGPLASDDAITRVLTGKPAPYLPVAPVYEMLGPLQFHRMESRWRKWRARLAQANTDLLPVDYQTHFQIERELYTEMLDGPYPPPAWLSLPYLSSRASVAGSAVVRRGDELFWLSADGYESWIPPNREAEQSVAAAEKSTPWSDLWDRSESASQVRDAAARPMHRLTPVPEPAPEQARELAASEGYELAICLARHYPNGLALYTNGTSPYNGLPDLFGFQGLMYALSDSPDLVHRILENRLPRPSARLAAERQLGITIMFVEECLASADILSPRMYQEFVFPYTRQALQCYEELGFRTVLYFSGNLMPFLPCLKELPFTALCFEENRKNYGIDLAEVRRALGPDRVLFGNMDAMLVEQASDEEVLAEVRRQIAVAGRDNFVVSLGSPLTPGTSLDRVRLVCESTRLL